MHIRHLFAIIFLTLFFLLGCQDESAPLNNVSPAADQEESIPQAVPPSPPIKEDFQGEPILSLFPRVGDYRPDDEERLPYWNTFIEHLSKVSGLVESKSDNNRAWSFRSINTIDSVGYFAPLAVQPGTRYQLSYRLAAELPEGASTGLGILEFNEFLWINQQYSESLFQEHYRGTHEGVRHTNSADWLEQTFSFTTGPDTRMIHLVLYRDGVHERKPVLFDDIEVIPTDIDESAIQAAQEKENSAR